MIFETTRDAIRITPENDLEIAYIEDTLSLTKEGYHIRLVRRHDSNDAIYLITESK
jgi:hypothetical protein